MAGPALVGLLLLPLPARATPCYGFDDGATKYQVAPTNPGGWTAHASIDAAVVAGTNAGRSVIEFQGTWTGIDETIKLRNSDLTFQGVNRNSLTWAANINAFGYGTNCSATISGLSLKTSGAGCGVAAVNSLTNTRIFDKLTVTNCTVSAETNAIWVGHNGVAAGMNTACGCDVTVTHSSIISSAARGIWCRVPGGGISISSNSVCVYDSRLQTYASGVEVDGTTAVGGGSRGSAAARIERSEIVCTKPWADLVAANDAGLCTWAAADGSFGTSVTYVASSLIAGFGTGVKIVPLKLGNGQIVTLLNNTLVNNLRGVGLIMDSTSFNTTASRIVGVNNIFAGNESGLFFQHTNTVAGANIRFSGNKNAFFANATDIYMNSVAGNSITTNDTGRIMPGYVSTGAFVDPANATLASRNYRLLPSASALLDAGQQFTTTSLGGTATYLDSNTNGVYNDGGDYVVDLGGGAPSALTRLLLTDAQYSDPRARLKGSAIDIGAYEGALRPGSKGLLHIVR